MEEEESDELDVPVEEPVPDERDEPDPPPDDDPLAE